MSLNGHFLKGCCVNGPQSYEKCLKFLTTHQGDANQKHSMMPPNLSKNGYYKQDRRHEF